MTASASIQVQPVGIIYPARIPQPPQPEQILKAKRCLFGPPDPTETRRIFEDDQQSNLQRFRDRFQIIGPLENVNFEQDHYSPEETTRSNISGPLPMDTTSPIQQTSNRPNELSENRNDGPQLESLSGQHNEVAPSSNETIITENLNSSSSSNTTQFEVELIHNSSEQNSRKGLIRCNPGPLGYFRVKKLRTQPYNRPSNQGSNPASNDSSS